MAASYPSWAGALRSVQEPGRSIDFVRMWSGSMGSLVDDGNALRSIQMDFIDLIDHHERGHMTSGQTFHRLEREQLIRRGLARLDTELLLHACDDLFSSHEGTG